MNDRDTKNELARARKSILDLLEVAIGSTDQWSFIRSRILKIFGRDGLSRLFAGGDHIENNNYQTDNKTGERHG